MAKAKLRLSKPIKSRKVIMKKLSLKRWKKVVDVETVTQNTVTIADGTECGNSDAESLMSFTNSSCNDNEWNSASNFENSQRNIGKNEFDSDEGTNEIGHYVDDSDNDDDDDSDTNTSSNNSDKSEEDIDKKRFEYYESADEELYCEKDTEFSENTLNISGRRIIDISYFLKQLKDLKHEGFGCTFFNMIIVSEKLMGLQSVFSFKCEVCNIMQTVKSENPESLDSTINSRAVLGSLATGIGYSQLTELFAAMDIPNMANKTYAKYQDKISVAINEENVKLMQEAGEEEAKLAIESGDVNLNGIPVISVVVDGAWSKRSYRTNYNALSGVACIIGAKTKKILYMGVKNKYCYVCTRTNNKAHNCYKNWNNSSTAMEAAIIVEGFQKSLEMHNLIYGRVIGDGDSSVYKKLTEAAPYGPTFVIEKIECRNHLLRNYLNKLAELSKNTRFPVVLRKKVTNSDTLGRFRNAVTKAIEYRKQTNDPFHIKANLLKKDIINGPRHIFGDHSKCDSYFCSKKEGEENLVPDLDVSGLLAVIMNINKHLAENACSLVHDVDTNPAETYNSIVAKFVGGKRTNFSLKGSYENRCKAAAISYNTNGNFLCKIQATLDGRSPGRYLQRFCERRTQASLANKSRTSLRRKKFATVDEHYGLQNANTVDDMESEMYATKAEEFLQNLKDTDNKRIFEETVGQSNSIVWKSERRKRITASNFGRICKLKRSTSTAKTVSSLLYNSFKGNTATRFGLEHEEIAIDLFQNQYNKKVEKSGLIIDAEFLFLGCSPDGLVNQDALIEIKSSEKSGNLSPLDAVRQGKIKYCVEKDGNILLKLTHNYYYQIQGLLHICKRELCYFIVYTKGGIHVEMIKRDDTFWKNRMESKLCEFYRNSVLPELIDPRRCRQLNIRDVYMQ